ncbi:MAG: nucleoside 2-deoxyribosyltransferase [Candidatus Gracilibacteria bacterium]|nr:nucleoside 2-deoxyribosyltransferase [Candidatus Gracilibacteria bacterium]
MKKIYFAGAIRGGREDVEIYKGIIAYLCQKGEVLTEHVGDNKIYSSGETSRTEDDIYNRDIDWLTSADFMVAEVSTPSLGVGFEIAKSVEQGKKILCLYRIQDGKRLSAMIKGCPNVCNKEYVTLDDAKIIINDFLEK